MWHPWGKHQTKRERKGSKAKRGGGEGGKRGGGEGGEKKAKRGAKSGFDGAVND